MPFSPSDISGLKIWLKADAGAGSSDNDPVGTWTDQSGTSHDFTQATSGKKPLYKVNIRNGLPVVRFDGSDDEMSGGDLTGVFTSAGSMVMAVNGTGVNNQFMPYETKANDPHWAYTSGEGYWGFFRSGRLNNTPGSGLPRTGWHLWSLTSSASVYKMWLDTVLKINDTPSFDGGNAHLLGRQPNAGYFQAMDLGEVVVYDSVLSDGNRQLVETYLRERWGFQVSGFVLTIVPSLPAGAVNQLQNLTGVALTITPTLPAAELEVAGVVFGLALTATPTLPAASLRTKLTPTPLVIVPSLPAGAIRRSITAVVLTASPNLPAGVLNTGPISITGVALITVPRLPAGMLHYGGSPGGASDFWLVYTAPADFS